MKTDEFNEKFEIDRKSKGVKALPKFARSEPAVVLTADNTIYDSNQTYYFFDVQTQEVRQSLGLRCVGEHLCTFGLKVVSISKLRLNQDDALSDGQRFFKSGIERLQDRIQKFELEKSAAASK